MTAVSTRTPPGGVPREELADIQALVFTAWKRLPHAAFLFVVFHPERTPARIARNRFWLGGLVDQVARASEISVAREADDSTVPTGGPNRLQLALSHDGLRAVGARDTELLGLADEAKQGMHRRARILGDGHDPTWELGGDGPRLGALLACYASEPAKLEAMVAEHKARLAAIDADVIDERTTWLGNREHFGFADGLSQPNIPGTRPPGKEDPANEVPAGELLLGYRNAYDRMPRGPMGVDRDGLPIDLGKNGTYLVFRKLEQHVEVFWNYFATQAAALRQTGTGPPENCAPAELDAWTEWLAAKVMGRWRSGAPMSLCPDYDDPAMGAPGVCNKFEYAANDPDGELCPIGSHIRRAYPRDARGAGESPEESRVVTRRHRILRRGRSYGTPIEPEAAMSGQVDTSGHRGLYFISLQASIARGFEFVQQSWLSNLGFAELSREGDPIVAGEVDPRGTPHDELTIPMSPIRLRLRGRPRMVTTRGGEYFFLPSITALRHWAGR
jgi:Dyp-type peroxidase family